MNANFGIQMMLTTLSLSLFLAYSAHADIDSAHVCNGHAGKGLQTASALSVKQAKINLDSVQKLVAPDGEVDDLFGDSVSVDGDTAVIGAPGDDCENCEENNLGSAYVFIKSGAEWIFQQKLTAPDAKDWDRFGESVSLDGDTLVIGAIDASPSDLQINGPGSAYVFVRSGTEWTLQQKLIAPDAEGWSEFGYSVSLDGDTVVIGDHKDSNENGSSAGSVYVFVRSGTEWTLQQKLLAESGETLDIFGASVSLEGDRVIIGAWGDYDNGTYSGTAYVFARSGTEWTQQQELTLPGGKLEEHDRYGGSVSLSGDTAVIGSSYGGYDNGPIGYIFVYCPICKMWTLREEVVSGGVLYGDTLVCLHSGKNTYSGEAYILERSTTDSVTEWVLQDTFTAPDSDPGEVFGSSSSMDGKTLILGADGHANNFSNVNDDPSPGAAYIYSSSGSPNDSSCSACPAIRFLMLKSAGSGLGPVPL